MQKIKQFIQQESHGWKAWEILWLSIACLTIISLSLYWRDSIIGIISATSGVICVVCTGKGKVSAYLFGIINTILYSYISLNAQFYGEVMLNALYYLPMQFYGFYQWNKHLNLETNEVVKRQMTFISFIKLLCLVGFLTFVYGLILTKIHGNLAYIDAFSTIASVFAMYLSVKRYAEQWILWILVNIVTIFMWSYAYFMQDSESIATLLMWNVYLINAIIMYIKWKKDSINSENRG